MKHLLICDNAEPERVIELCKAEGLGIELQAFYSPKALIDSDLIAQAQKLSEAVAPRSMHGPFGDLCPGSFDDEVRALARKRFEQAWVVATQLDVAHVVLHHGYVPHTSWPSGWLERWPKFFKEFLQGKDPGIQIHIENHLDADPNLISDAVAAVESDQIDICLDIGHVHFASDVPVVEWIERLGEQIGYVHMHDNHGTEDEHLGLGQGTMPMKEVCAALEQHTPNAIWALEAELAAIPQSLDWLQKYGFLKEAK